jgi:hypothetical protein
LALGLDLFLSNESLAPIDFFSETSLPTLLIIFLISFAYAFPASAIGFWIMFFILKLKLPINYYLQSFIFAIILELATLMVFFQKLNFLIETKSSILVFFPFLPLLLSSFSFSYLIKKHLKQFV